MYRIALPQMGYSAAAPGLEAIAQVEILQQVLHLAT